MADQRLLMKCGEDEIVIAVRHGVEWRSSRCDGDPRYLTFGMEQQHCDMRFIAAANPAALLSLLDERERLLRELKFCRLFISTKQQQFGFTAAETLKSIEAVLAAAGEE